MDQISIKKPIPKCRPYCCLIQFIDWRYSQSCWYMNPSCELAPIYLLTGLPTPPPHTFPVWVSTKVYVFIQCVTGGGDRGPQTDKHLPPSTFTGKFLRKADIWSMRY
jgi:hypothetical protein